MERMLVTYLVVAWNLQAPVHTPSLRVARLGLAVLVDNSRAVELQCKYNEIIHEVKRNTKIPHWDSGAYHYNCDNMKLSIYASSCIQCMPRVDETSKLKYTTWRPVYTHLTMSTSHLDTAEAGCSRNRAVLVELVDRPGMLELIIKHTVLYICTTNYTSTTKCDNNFKQTWSAGFYNKIVRRRKTLPREDIRSIW